MVLHPIGAAAQNDGSSLPLVAYRNMEATRWQQGGNKALHPIGATAQNDGCPLPLVVPGVIIPCSSGA